MSKTQDKIKELLGSGAEMEESQIREELESKYNLALTYDTIIRHLDQMVENDVLDIKRRSKPSEYSDKKKTWYNFYSLKQKR
jgi:hypothetical protein